MTDTAAQTCPQCLHARHGRRVCRDANCCSCRLTWRDAWKAGYMQGWRDYPSALWRGFDPPTEVEMESENMDSYPLDHPGCPDRSEARRPAHDDAVRPRSGELGPARQLHPGGVHGRSDLERRADALTTLAASYRRVFIR